MKVKIRGRLQPKSKESKERQKANKSKSEQTATTSPSLFNSAAGVVDAVAVAKRESMESGGKSEKSTAAPSPSDGDSDAAGVYGEQ